MQKHVREYQIVSEQSLCSECDETRPNVWCTQCKALYCSLCDVKAHQFKGTRQHDRKCLHIEKVENEKKLRYIETTPKIALSSESESEIESEMETAPVKVKEVKKVKKVKKSDTMDETIASKKRKIDTKSHSSRNSATISEGSTHSLVKRMEAYRVSIDSTPMHLSTSLNSFERLLAHDCAERLGLQHQSIGEGLDRHIIISK